MPTNLGFILFRPNFYSVEISLPQVAVYCQLGVVCGDDHVKTI